MSDDDAADVARAVKLVRDAYDDLHMPITREGVESVRRDIFDNAWAVVVAHDDMRDERDAALARADLAERECADLHDALDRARGLIDDALASVRRRDQAGAWAQAAAAVEAATQP